MLHLEMFRQGGDEFYDHSHFLTSVKLLLRVQTVVAGTAVFLSVFFTEIVEQQLSAARIRFCVCNGFH